MALGKDNPGGVFSAALGAGHCSAAPACFALAETRVGQVEPCLGAANRLRNRLDGFFGGPADGRFVFGHRENLDHSAELT